MAYCRFDGTSDVYVFYDGESWTVQINGITERETREDTRDLLMRLRSMGLRIPQHAINRLEKEMEGNDNK